MHCIPLASLLQKRTLLDYSQPLLPPSLSPWSDPPGWRSPGTAARRTERTGGSRSCPPVRPGRIKSRGRPAWGHPSSEIERGQVGSGQGGEGGLTIGVGGSMVAAGVEVEVRGELAGWN